MQFSATFKDTMSSSVVVTSRLLLVDSVKTEKLYQIWLKLSHVFMDFSERKITNLVIQ